ncbi:N-acetylmuramoyl-L-alanine amidase [Desulfonispora thiosulfatigenes DSM 11270]|uniref:N-acetylmuramoyl-L-alanine amidase n=1 Tax=Desulfonispora thiosulfatigenes DSM 11270 TaxID=656914 RepID=A0A1W1VQC7_DESTI|nr:peptidoglycan recognition family protein [Desulfonispora thiosulfatigenes]SMB95291.1 N-acetylmuramoyl-L-alanine amidase [Desulfonispora thiosulfatigenes DSM 11270]
MNKPDKIILHHSATDGGTFESIKRYHMQTNGWRDIGYHYLIEQDGSLHKGRAENDTGAHCKEQRCNFTSLGICLVGNFDKYEPNQKQLDTLDKLLKDIFNRYGKLSIYTHNHFAGYKTCPGTRFPMDKVINRAHSNNTGVSEVAKSWQQQTGEKAIDSLAKKGLIANSKDWKGKDLLNENTPLWLFFEMMNRISGVR